MIMLLFGTYFLTVVSDHQGTDDRDPDLDNYFGSMLVTVLSLFQMTTGGFDWKEVSDLLMPVSPMAVIVLCAYMAMMSYAILNILTGICVNTATKTAEDDFDISMLEDQMREESAASQLAKHFHDHDESGNGEIT